MGSRRGPTINTFSIVGRDPETGQVGVAVATKFLAVGAGVPHGEYGVGAVAVQAEHHPEFGERTMEALRDGLSPEAAVEAALTDDDRRGYRQLGVVDAQGRSYSFTGEDCGYWAGGVAVENAAAQGNMLVNEATVTAMIEVFQTSSDSLPERLLAALTAGDQAGGDSRGRQSTALYVRGRPEGTSLYREGKIDLRVDDHPEPFGELKRLLRVRYRIHGSLDPDRAVEMDDATCRRVQESLFNLGYLERRPTGQYDEVTRKALKRFAYRENLRRRLDENGRFDEVFLDHLIQQGRSLARG